MNLRGMMVVFKKELKDMFRDRKTLIISILIPLLIFPIMFGLMGRGMEKSTKQVMENLKLVLVDKGNSSLGQFLKSQANIKLVESQDVKLDVQEGKAYIGVIIPEDLESKVKDEKPVDIQIMYDDTSQNSNTALGVVNSLIDSYTKEVVKTRLVSKGIDVTVLEPLGVQMQVVAKEKGGIGKFILSLILPMMLIIYAMTGPMAAATDLGAGEKERGTLEPLLTTQTSRMNLLFGKFFAITVMGLIGTTSSLVGVFLGFKTGGSTFGGEMAMLLPVKALALMGICALLLTMVFGALELSISIYARSFKEAQTYLSPFTIIGMIAAYGTYAMDVKNISGAIFNIPLVNIVVIIKELISGIYNTTHMVITLAWSIVYIVGAVLFARYMFSREEVIFRT